MISDFVKRILFSNLKKTIDSIWVNKVSEYQTIYQKTILLLSIDFNLKYIVDVKIQE